MEWRILFSIWPFEYVTNYLPSFLPTLHGSRLEENGTFVTVTWALCLWYKRTKDTCFKQSQNESTLMHAFKKRLNFGIFKSVASFRNRSSRE